MLLNYISELPTPCHIIDLDKIRSNINVLSILRKKLI